MSRPNFIFLMTDHQQASTVASAACHTPNMDRISARGVRFSRCYTVNAICSPSRATLFTGLHVHAHGMYDCTHTVDESRARFRADLPTWSGALADAGYHCAYFGKWHVERSGDLSRFGWRHQGDDNYKAWRHANGHGDAPVPELLVKLEAERGYSERPICGVTDDPVEATRTAQIFSSGAGYLTEQMQGDEPWCLFLSTPDPHDPYIVPRSYYDMYDPAAIAQPPSFDDDLHCKPNVLKRMQSVYDDLEWEDFARAIACYYAQCTVIDSQVGVVLDALEQTGQADNTVIVLLTDHADLLGAHRMFTKGVTPYEEVYNVPLIISAPERRSGALCERIVSIGDLCPTVLELAGLEPFEVSHFRSLCPLLEDPAGAGWEDEAYAEFHGQRYFFTQRILWHDDTKYVLNAYDYDEMYDLAADPYELENVAYTPAYASRKDDMLKRIWRRVHATGDATLANAQYNSLRFLDLGPDCVEHD